MIYTSFKRALILNTILVATLPILVFGMITLRVQRKSIETVIIGESKALVRSMAAETRDYLQQSLRSLSALAELDKSDRGVTRAIISSLLDKMPGTPGRFESILMLDRNGTVVADSVAPHMDSSGRKSRIGLNLSSMEVCRTALTSRISSWSSTFISPLSGQVVLNLAIPSKDGMLVGTLGISHLDAIAERIGEDNGYAYIVNREGRLIVHPDPMLVAEQYDASDVSIIREGLAGKEL